MQTSPLPPPPALFNRPSSCTQGWGWEGGGVGKGAANPTAAGSPAFLLSWGVWLCKLARWLTSSRSDPSGSSRVSSSAAQRLANRTRGAGKRKERHLIMQGERKTGGNIWGKQESKISIWQQKIEAIRHVSAPPPPPSAPTRKAMFYLLTQPPAFKHAAGGSCAPKRLQFYICIN